MTHKARVQQHFCELTREHDCSAIRDGLQHTGLAKLYASEYLLSDGTIKK